MSNIAIPGRENITLVSTQKYLGQIVRKKNDEVVKVYNFFPIGRKMRLDTALNNFRSPDLETFMSLPERFHNPRHIEKFNLDAFKTKKREYFMLNGQLLDVNKANKDVVSKVVLLLKHIKRDNKDFRLNCFIDEAFMDKMAPIKHQPAKEALAATGKFFKSIGKGLVDFVFH